MRALIVDEEIARKFASLLREKEDLLWTGQPRQGLRFVKADLFLFPFTLLWCGFAMFWEASVLLGGAPIFMAIWGLPFVVIGLYMVIGRFFYNARVRKNTFYALSSRRLLITHGGLFSQKTTTVNIDKIVSCSLEQFSGGRGTIDFSDGQQHGSRQGQIAMLQGTGWPGVGEALAFSEIADVAEVFECLETIREQGVDSVK